MSSSDRQDADWSALKEDSDTVLLATSLIALHGDEVKAKRLFSSWVQSLIESGDFQPDLPPEPRRRAAQWAAAAVGIALAEST